MPHDGSERTVTDIGLQAGRFDMASAIIDAGVIAEVIQWGPCY
jgi:hypothetical protein